MRENAVIEYLRHANLLDDDIASSRNVPALCVGQRLIARS
jgi:hypothetical protein